MPNRPGGNSVLRTDPHAPLSDAGAVLLVIAALRGEWLGELAELTRQIATGERPGGDFHPVYEALIVTINQLAVTDRVRVGNGIGAQPHPALPGRQL